MTRPPAPIGRSAAWSALLPRLDHPGGSVVVIAGEPGTGRSHLLRAFAEAAHQRGFRTIGCGESAGIDNTTKLTDLARIVDAMLDAQGVTASAPPAPGAGMLRNIVNTVATNARAQREIFELIDNAVPIVVGVDGYAPSATLDLWFTTRLVTHLHASGRPATLAVTGHGRALSAMRQVADVTIDLGPLDRDEVTAHLVSLTHDLRPPLSPDELSAYATVAAADPRRLPAFSRVLAAAARER
jgi:AAA ATPase domain